MKTAQIKYNWIMKQLDNGKTIYITSEFKDWEISKKTIDRFKEKDFFKIIDKSLYMIRGKKYYNIDWLNLSAK